MAQEFLLPDPGEGIHEAEILEVFVSAGDEVNDGDPLFSVETDKAVVDVPASFVGVIEEVRVESGETVEVGSVLLTFTEDGESAEDEESEREESSGEDDEEAVEDETGESEDDEVEESEGDESSDGDDEEAVEEEAGESEDEESEGEDEDDAAVDEKGKDDESERPPVPASPATRSLAKKLDVDIGDLEGSGPDGRIEPGDVQAAAEQDDHEAKGDAPKAEDEGVQWQDLGGVRKATARHMAEAWREIPHVTHHDVADITELETVRNEYAAEVEDAGGRLSITAFLVKAAAAALEDHPRFNARIDIENNRIEIRREVNIGVAVDTEDGLLVPVIRNVSEKSIVDIAIELPQIAERMRSGDRALEELSGGTFTITNPGGIGGTSFNPIINHPEVAILGAARARQVPVVAEPAQEGDSPDIDVRLQLPLVLAFDHRLNDGADAARFVNSVKELIEEPNRLALRV